MKHLACLFGLTLIAACGSPNTGTNLINQGAQVSTRSAQGSISLAGRQPREYAGLARISQQLAIRIATQRVTGTVTKASLENENGFLVYAIGLTGSQGPMELLIDAGNGNILVAQSGNPGQPDSGDQNSQNDGETKD